MSKILVENHKRKIVKCENENLDDVIFVVNRKNISSFTEELSRFSTKILVENEKDLFFIKVSNPPHCQVLKYKNNCFVNIYENIYVLFGFSCVFFKEKTSCLIDSKNIIRLPQSFFGNFSEYITINSYNKTKEFNPNIINISLQSNHSEYKEPNMYLVNEEKFNSFIKNIDSSILEGLYFAKYENQFVVLNFSNKMLPFINSKSFSRYLNSDNIFIENGFEIVPKVRQTIIKELILSDNKSICYLEFNDSVVINKIAVDSFVKVTEYIYYTSKEKLKLNPIDIKNPFSYTSYRKEQQKEQNKINDFYEISSNKPVKSLIVDEIEKKKETVKNEIILEEAFDNKHFSALKEAQEKFIDIVVKNGLGSVTNLWIELAKISGSVEKNTNTSVYYLNSIWYDFSEKTIQDWFEFEGKVDKIEQGVHYYKIFSNYLARNDMDVSKITEYFNNSFSSMPIKLSWLVACKIYKETNDLLNLIRVRDKIISTIFENGYSFFKNIPSFLKNIKSKNEIDNISIEDMELLFNTVKNHTIGSLETFSNKNNPTIGYFDLEIAYLYSKMNVVEKRDSYIDKAKKRFEQEEEGTKPIGMFMFNSISDKIKNIDNKDFNEFNSYNTSDVIESLKKIQQNNQDSKIKRNIVSNSNYVVASINSFMKAIDNNKILDPTIFSGEGEELKEILNSKNQEDFYERFIKFIDSKKSFQEKVKYIVFFIPFAIKFGDKMVNYILDNFIKFYEFAEFDSQQFCIRFEKTILLATLFDKNKHCEILVDSYINQMMSKRFEKETKICYINDMAIKLGKILSINKNTSFASKILDLYLDITKDIDVSNSMNLSAMFNTMIFKKLVKDSDDYLKYQKMIEKYVCDEVKWKQAGSGSFIIIKMLISYIYSVLNLDSENQVKKLTEFFKKLPKIAIGNVKWSCSEFYSRSHLVVFDEIIQSLSGDKFINGTLTKKICDEEEFILRNRINSELNDLMNQNF